MIPIKEIPKEQFEQELLTVHRIWDGSQGLTRKQASQKKLNPLSHIFIRDDGWKIACERFTYESCYNLWPDEWEEILKVSQ